ncbi:hypothetical protein [Pigmentiphaga aceris]|nr:hypothetical protein [Pigmentiphaga aceris]
MLRKLIMFAITSGLASKLYKSFREGRLGVKPQAQAQARRPGRNVPPV